MKKWKRAALAAKQFGGRVVAGVSATVASVAAYAAPQDYSGVQSAVTAEITAAMPSVLLVFGTLAGIGVGLRLIGRATKAR